MKYTPEQTDKFFRDRLEVLGITQAELAERAGFTPADISRYKSQRQRPRIENIEALAEALELDVLTVMIGLGAINPQGLATPKVVAHSKGKITKITWPRK